MCNEQKKGYTIQVEETSVDTTKKTIGVQIPNSMYLKLKQKADRNFISVSDIVRGVLFKYLENEEE